MPNSDTPPPEDPDAAVALVGDHLRVVSDSLKGEQALRRDDILGLTVITHAGLVGYATKSYAAPMPTHVDAICQASLGSLVAGNEKLFEVAGCVRSEGTPPPGAYREAVAEWFHGWFQDIYLLGLEEWYATAVARASCLRSPPSAEEDANVEASRALAVACAFFRAIQASGVYAPSGSDWSKAISKGLGAAFVSVKGVMQAKLDTVAISNAVAAQPLAFRGKDGRLHLRWREVQHMLADEAGRPRLEEEGGIRAYGAAPASLDAPISADEEASTLAETRPAKSGPDVVDRLALRHALDALAGKYAKDLVRREVVEYIRAGSTDVDYYAKRAHCSPALISTRSGELLEELRRMLNPSDE